MSSLLLAQVAGAAAKVAEPALSVLTQSIIGALLVISWAIAIVAVWQLIKVQNERVADQKASNDKAERLLEKMVTAFTEMKEALNGLRRSEEQGQQVIQGLKNSFDLSILASQRRMSPPRGMPAQRSEDSRREDKR